jgi:hypothetical protein
MKVSSCTQACSVTCVCIYVHIYICLCVCIYGWIDLNCNLAHLYVGLFCSLYPFTCLLFPDFELGFDLFTSTLVIFVFTPEHFRPAVCSLRCWISFTPVAYVTCSISFEVDVVRTCLVDLPIYICIHTCVCVYAYIVDHCSSYVLYLHMFVYADT